MEVWRYGGMEGEREINGGRRAQWRDRFDSGDVK